MKREELLEHQREQFARRLSDWKRVLRGESLWEHAVGIAPEYDEKLFRIPEPTHIPEDWNVKYPYKMAFNRIVCSLGWGVPISNEINPEFAAIELPVPPEERNINPIELQIEFPEMPEIPREQWEEVIWQLSQCGQISFELVAANSKIILQFVCDEGMRLPVRRILSEALPEVRIREERSHLIDHFYAKTKDSAGMVQEFGLAKDFIFPLKTWQPHEADPLSPIVDMLRGLGSDECGFYQVTFTAVQSAWRASFENLCMRGDPLPASLIFEDAKRIGPMKQKLTRWWVAAVVRVGFRTNDLEKAKSNCQALDQCLRLEDAGTNRLCKLSNHGVPGSYGIQEHIEHAVIRQHKRTGMLLSLDEIFTLVHLPLARADSPRVQIVHQKTKTHKLEKIPTEVENGGVFGFCEHLDATREVVLSLEQRSRHAYVIGVSGTGKSTLLFGLVLADMLAGRGCAVLDPHGDLIEQLLEYVPKDRLNDVVLIDPADEEYPIGFNILSAGSDAERNLLASDLVAVFRRLSTAWGDQMNAVLANAILAFLENPKGGTLVDLRHFLVDKEFRLKYLEGVVDEGVRYYWSKEFPMLSGKPQGPILTRLDAFLRPKMIRNMVSQKQNKLDFPALMRDKKIVFAKLTHGAIGEENAHLLGSLLVARIHQAALGRQSLPQAERKLFNLYIDEFHNFMTPSIASILSGGRKYGLGLTLAHQELRQLWSRDEQVASAVLANPATRICFRTGEWDAQKLAEGFSFFNSKDIQSLRRGEAICRVDTRENDFNMTTIAWDLISPGNGKEWRDKVVAQSREHYAIPTHILKGASVAEAPRAESEVEPEGPSVPVAAAPGLPPPAKVEVTTPESTPKISEEPQTDAFLGQPGKGGRQHKYLQGLIQRLAEEKGWFAEIEKSVLDGAGSVDVSLERNGKRIACEISVTTTPNHELGNAQKCLASGYELVALVSPYQKTISKLRKLLDEMEEEAKKRTLLFTVEEFILFLEKQELGETTTETIVKGRIVKTSFRAPPPEEYEAKKKAIAQTILAALKRMKGQ